MKTRLILIILLLSCLGGYAQNTKDDIIFRAMEDEMQRSLDSLTYKDHPKAFFISYALYDTDYLSIYSSIGGLDGSDEDFNRSWGIRLMLGDYDLNDENYENWDYSLYSSSGYGEVEMPIDNDYLAMRKSWWLLTDNIYRRAVKAYERKLKTIEEHSLEGNELLLPDFSREDTHHLILDHPEYTIDRKALEEKMNALSGACLLLPGITYSHASLVHNKSDAYLLNSEGTRFKVPLDKCTLSLNLTTEDTNKREFEESMSIICQNPDQLPENELIMEEAGKLTEFLLASVQAPKMDEDYSGPVLIEGQPAAHMLCNSLFAGEGQLIAERQALIDNNDNVYFNPLENNLQRKYNKKVLPADISISVYPRLQEYNGIPLLGASYIDYEGVVPPDTILLVEKGILRDMMSTRIPTTVSKNSKGNYRMYAGSFSVTTTQKPGVVHFSSSNTLAEDELRSKFLAYAEENGFEHAYIIRSLPGDMALYPVGVYRVNTATGEEELVRNAALKSQMKVRDYKDIIAFGETVKVWNLSNYSSSFPASIGINMDYYYYDPGGVMSVIAPGSFIIDDFPIERIEEIDHLQKEVDYLPNPVKAYKKELE